MKIGLLADTQGSFDVEALLAYVAKEFAGVDEIWHAGDWGSADVLEGLRRLGRLVVVNGNAPNDSRYPTTIEGTIGRWRLGMVHDLDRPDDVIAFMQLSRDTATRRLLQELGVADRAVASTPPHA